ncbi:HIT family protein [Enterococcus sp. LJL90]
MEFCPFCNLDRNQILFENNSAQAFFDKNPVSPGHILIVPKKHKIDYFALSDSEKLDIEKLLETCKSFLDETESPDGYNIGFNCGEVAGQSIFHCHCHLIPRYKGDTPNPKGGIRGAIPDKMFY